jgi:hypothetical protein
MGFDTNKWFKQKYFSEAGVILESELVKALNQAIPDNTGYKEFAKAVATILKDEYGSHNFGPFMEILHSELGIDESINEVSNEYPDSPEALSAATAKAREILDKHKASIKAIANKYEGQPNKSREMQDELNDLIDADLEGVPFQSYVSNKVRATLGKALFRYFASKNPELAKMMK